MIGVNVEFLDLTKVVQFIKNGSLMGQSIIKGSNKDIYPSLGFQGLPATVHVTWPSARPDPPPTFSKVSSWGHMGKFKGQLTLHRKFTVMICDVIY